MDIAKEIATYIQTAGFGTIGTDIFIGQIPAITNGVYILRASGSAENYLPIENSLLDIYVKNQSSEQAITKIENIKRFMHRMHNTTTQNAYLYSILLIGDVEVIERTDDYQKIYKFTLEIKHRALNLIS